MRLNPNCETFDEVFEYYTERAIQLYADGYIIRHIEPISNIGTLATFFKGDKEYHSFYLYASKRGKGIYKKIIDNYDWNIITTFWGKDLGCDLSSYLKKHKVKFYTSLHFLDWQEYQIISEYYKDDCAKRSGLPYMNHIDEGLAILKWIGASTEAKKAYCIHPIVQPDEKLSEGLDLLDKKSNIYGISTKVMANTMEYRSVANSYLSSKDISSIEEIKISPLKDVNDMLIADKIQNRKDFELYHKGTHADSDKLTVYFRRWLQRLGVSERMYHEYKNRLNVRSQII